MRKFTFFLRLFIGLWSLFSCFSISSSLTCKLDQIDDKNMRFCLLKKKRTVSQSPLFRKEVLTFSWRFLITFSLEAYLRCINCKFSFNFSFSFSSCRSFSTCPTPPKKGSIKCHQRNLIWFSTKLTICLYLKLSTSICLRAGPCSTPRTLVAKFSEQSVSPTSNELGLICTNISVLQSPPEQFF